MFSPGLSLEFHCRRAWFIYRCSRIAVEDGPKLKNKKCFLSCMNEIRDYFFMRTSAAQWMSIEHEQNLQIEYHSSPCKRMHQLISGFIPNIAIKKVKMNLHDAGAGALRMICSLPPLICEWPINSSPAHENSSRNKTDIFINNKHSNRML